MMMMRTKMIASVLQDNDMVARDCSACPTIQAAASSKPTNTNTQLLAAMRRIAAAASGVLSSSRAGVSKLLRVPITVITSSKLRRLLGGLCTRHAPCALRSALCSTPLGCLRQATNMPPSS